MDKRTALQRRVRKRGNLVLYARCGISSVDNLSGQVLHVYLE